MSEYTTILYFLYAPEVFCILSLMNKDSRSWIIRLVEDSDGDPHHTDGLFIVILYLAMWCFRIGFIAMMKQIYFDKNLIDVAATSFGVGASLLGVRLFKNKIIPKN